MSKIIVVGGGVIGTMHAYFALKSGHEVVQVERDLVPQSASVRNFGLIWVSGRLAGSELDLALRARTLWEEIGQEATIGFRGNGSLTLAKDEKEFSLLIAASNMPDANKRGFELLNSQDVKKLEPALQGGFFGGLRCVLDGAVEPKLLLSGLRHKMSQNKNYNWRNNFEVIDISISNQMNYIVGSNQEKIYGDYIIICPGIFNTGFMNELMDTPDLRKVYLQMGATEPLGDILGHSLADIDSLRYYPAFKNLPLNELPAQNQIASDNHMQLLLCQRNDGSMTIGDTHIYQEPFPHEIFEEPYRHLSNVINGFFGRDIRIEKRWNGIYSQSTNENIYYRKEVSPNVVLITGGGGRGNTLSPAIAEETFTKWQL